MSWRAPLLSELDEADRWVLHWAESSPSLLTEQIELLALLITAPSQRVRAAGSRFASALRLSDELARELVVSTIANSGADTLLGLAERRVVLFFHRYGLWPRHGR